MSENVLEVRKMMLYLQSLDGFLLNLVEIW